MKKWWAPILVYAAVAIGLFVFRTAWASLLSFHVGILLALFLAKPNIPVKVLFTSHDIRWALLSLLVCGSSGISLYFFWDRFGVTGDIARRVEEMGLASPAVWVAFIAYFTFINPLLEEYFWRAYLGSKTSDFHVSDFFYAGFHGLILLDKVHPDMIVYSLALLILAGWFWRQLMRADDGLLAPLVGHMAADLTILLAVYLRVEG